MRGFADTGDGSVGETQQLLLAPAEPAQEFAFELVDGLVAGELADRAAIATPAPDEIELGRITGFSSGPITRIPHPGWSVDRARGVRLGEFRRNEP